MIFIVRGVGTHEVFFWIICEWSKAGSLLTFRESGCSTRWGGGEVDDGVSSVELARIIHGRPGNGLASVA